MGQFSKQLGILSFFTILIAAPPALSQNLGSNAAYNSGQNVSGAYLTSHFAQHNHDWKRAKEDLEHVLEAEPNNTGLLKRTMVLAMGTGDMTRAVEIASRLYDMKDQNVLVHLFLSIDAINQEDFQQAGYHLDQMPNNGLANFVLPLLRGWINAADGKFNTKSLHKNSIHIQHALLIADFGKSYDQIKTLLSAARNKEDLSAENLEKIADIYYHIGERETASELYAQILKTMPDHKAVRNKHQNVADGKDIHIVPSVKTPKHGVAIALYDMAQLLFQEESDESARIFAHMALALEPDLADARFILGEIAAEHDHYEEAASHFGSFNKETPRFIEAQYRMADLQENNDDDQSAINTLSKLHKELSDIEALIKIGDIHRRNENFMQAIQSYNEAEQTLGNKIPASFWHLHYVRGISYEQAGDWEKAEQDLEAALSFQPNHPYVLNYLGYAWVDKGLNLDRSLALLAKAVDLQPSDGFIRDSLGWAHYRKGSYQEAVHHLEQAVELEPYDPVINEHLGDAYWRSGRKLEARFQWQKAQDFAGEEEIILKLTQKLEQGLNDYEEVMEARSQNAGVNSTDH